MVNHKIPYEYLRVKDNSSNFAMEKIRSPTDIYPVFRELFKNNLRDLLNKIVRD